MVEEDIKKLHPEDRIKRLKELEKQKKKEIEEAHKIIIDSEQELSSRKRWVEKVPIPEFAQDDFSGLGEDAIRILEQHQGIIRRKSSSEGEVDKKEEGEVDKKEEKEKKETKGQDLEETVNRDPRRLPPEAHLQYGIPGQQAFGEAYKPLHDMTSREILGVVENIYQAREERGYLLTGERELLGKSLYEADQRKSAIGEGNYQGSIDEAIQATSLIQQKAGRLYHSGSANQNYK